MYRESLLNGKRLIKPILNETGNFEVCHQNWKNVADGDGHLKKALLWKQIRWARSAEVSFLPFFFLHLKTNRSIQRE